MSKHLSQCSFNDEEKDIFKKIGKELSTFFEYVRTTHLLRIDVTSTPDNVFISGGIISCLYSYFKAHKKMDTTVFERTFEPHFPDLDIYFTDVGSIGFTAFMTDGVCMEKDDPKNEYDDSFAVWQFPDNVQCLLYKEANYKKILDQFDMEHLKIAYFPVTQTFKMSPRSHVCLRDRVISLTEHAQDDDRGNRRITKYMKRGFVREMS